MTNFNRGQRVKIKTGIRPTRRGGGLGETSYAQLFNLQQRGKGYFVVRDSDSFRVMIAEDPYPVPVEWLEAYSEEWSKGDSFVVDTFESTYSIDVTLGKHYKVIEVRHDNSTGDIVGVAFEDDAGDLHGAPISDIHKVQEAPVDEWVEVERIEHIGSENGTLHVRENHRTRELRLQRGCFEGTLDEFEERVGRKPKGDIHRDIYEGVIKNLKQRFPDYAGEEPKGYIRFTAFGKDTGTGRDQNYVNEIQTSEKHYTLTNKQQTSHHKTLFTWEEAVTIAAGSLRMLIEKDGQDLDTPLVWVPKADDEQKGKRNLTF